MQKAVRVHVLHCLIIGSVKYSYRGGWRYCSDTVDLQNDELFEPHQIPDQRQNRQTLLPVQRPDPAHEPLPVQGRNLENKGDTLHLKTIVLIGGEEIGIREPGAAHAARQRNDKDETVCSPDNNGRPDTPLLVSLRIREIDEPDIAVLHQVLFPKDSSDARCQMPVSFRKSSRSSGVDVNRNCFAFDTPSAICASE